MKTNKFFTIVLTIGIISISTSFGQVFQKGTRVLNLGLGLGGNVYYLNSGYNSTPYFNLSFDYGVYNFSDVDNLSLGIGGYFGYKNVWNRWNTWWYDKNGNLHLSGGFRENWNYFSFGIRPTIHYSFDNNFQVYGGFQFGYVLVSYSNTNPNFYYTESYGSRLGIGMLVAARYMFSKSFGAYGELGFGMTYLNLGVSFKF